MSKQFPEGPLANHANCKDLYNSKLCAMARKDKKCLKKNSKPRKKKQIEATLAMKDKFETVASTHEEREYLRTLIGASKI